MEVTRGTIVSGDVVTDTGPRKTAIINRACGEDPVVSNDAVNPGNLNVVSTNVVDTETDRIVPNDVVDPATGKVMSIT